MEIMKLYEECKKGNHDIVLINGQMFLGDSNYTYWCTNCGAIIEREKKQCDEKYSEEIKYPKSYDYLTKEEDNEII